MNSEDYRKKIEEDILRTIEERLVSQQMDAERAKQIARLILDSLHPQMTFNQIHEVVQKFDDYFPELATVVAGVNHDYDDQVRQVVSDYAGKLIAQGKTNEAITTIHQALNKQVKLPDPS